jgi:hypothetical protein
MTVDGALTGLGREENGGSHMRGKGEETNGDFACGAAACWMARAEMAQLAGVQARTTSGRDDQRDPMACLGWAVSREGEGSGALQTSQA